MAGGAPAWGDLRERRRRLAAEGHGVGAARMEVAARRRVQGRGNLALDGTVGGLAVLDFGHLAQEGLGVGVVGRGEELRGGAFLDQAAQVHDHDAVGDVLDHADGVADEEVAQGQFLAQFHEEVEDLGLDGDVQGGHGLVGDDQLGAHGQCAGYADALALAARELVGIAVHVGGVQAAAREGLGHPGVEVFRGHEAVDEGGLADDVPHAEARIQGGVGVLEDHLGAQGLEALGLGAGVGQGDAVIEDFARAGRKESHGHAAQGGLAAAGLADQAHDFAPGQGEAHVVDGAHGALVDMAAQALHEPGGQVEFLGKDFADALDGEDGIAHTGSSSLWGWWQRQPRPGPSSVSAGSRSQAASARGQRARKAHSPPRARGEGVMPGIW